MIASPRFSLLLALNIWDLGLKWWQESMLASHLFPIGSKLTDAFLSLFLLQGVCVKGILCLLIFILSWGKPSEGPWSRWVTNTDLFSLNCALGGIEWGSYSSQMT